MRKRIFDLGDGDRILYDSKDGRLKVSKGPYVEYDRCFHDSTNEVHSTPVYSSTAFHDTVVGIIGGGEQLFSFSTNPNVREIIGIDRNTSQVSLFLGKIASVKESMIEKKPVMRLAGSMWYGNVLADYPELGYSLKRSKKKNVKDKIDNYVHDFGRRVGEGSIRTHVIVNDVIDSLDRIIRPRDATVYLSNVADFVETDRLVKSAAACLDRGCNVVGCKLTWKKFNEEEEKVELFAKDMAGMGYTVEKIVSHDAKDSLIDLNEVIYNIFPCGYGRR
jgi:hypothetical protein